MKNIEILVSNKLISYESALKFMEKKINHVKEKKSKELIWFLEHPSIYTSGRGKYVDVKFINNIPVYNTGRGGKITWHGPGQRIIYFVIDVKKRNIDIRRFVSNIENFIIKTLEHLNIRAFKKEKLVGIWTVNKIKKEAKIGSLGLRVSKGIIYHGVSLNISCNLENFYKIEPCGISKPSITSITEINGFIKTKYVDTILKKNLYLLFY